MTNLLLLPSAGGSEDPIQDVKRGVLVREIDHAWIDPSTGDCVLAVRRSRLIENGSLTAPLKPMFLRASPSDFLAGIRIIGPDFAFEQHRGFCLKSGGAIRVGIGQPTVVVDGVIASEAPIHN